MIVSPDGLRVRVSISDPWDFYAENGPLAKGMIVSVRDESPGHRPEFRIELEKPLKQKRLAANQVFASPRHGDYTMERFLSGEELAFGFSNCSREDWGQRSPEERLDFVGGLQLESL